MTCEAIVCWSKYKTPNSPLENVAYPIFRLRTVFNFPSFGCRLPSAKQRKMVCVYSIQANDHSRLVINNKARKNQTREKLFIAKAYYYFG